MKCSLQVWSLKSGPRNILAIWSPGSESNFLGRRNLLVYKQTTLRLAFFSWSHLPSESIFRHLAPTVIMVNLYASLLSLALVTACSLAFSHGYQRRNELDSNLHRRESVDSHEIAFAREDNEAREPGSSLRKFKFLSKLTVHHPGKGPAKRPTSRASRRIVNKPDKLVQEAIEFQNTFGVRDLDAEGLFAREYDQLDERDIFDDLD